MATFVLLNSLFIFSVYSSSSCKRCNTDLNESVKGVLKSFESRKNEICETLPNYDDNNLVDSARV